MFSDKVEGWWCMISIVYRHAHTNTAHLVPALCSVLKLGIYGCSGWGEMGGGDVTIESTEVALTFLRCFDIIIYVLHSLIAVLPIIGINNQTIVPLLAFCVHHNHPLNLFCNNHCIVLSVWDYSWIIWIVISIIYEITII